MKLEVFDDMLYIHLNNICYIIRKFNGRLNTSYNDIYGFIL